jgi:hypothetical protein
MHQPTQLKGQLVQLLAELLLINHRDLVGQLLVVSQLSFQSRELRLQNDSPLR